MCWFDTMTTPSRVHTRPYKWVNSLLTWSNSTLFSNTHFLCVILRRDKVIFCPAKTNSIDTKSTFQLIFMPGPTKTGNTNYKRTNTVSSKRFTPHSLRKKAFAWKARLDKPPGKLDSCTYGNLRSPGKNSPLSDINQVLCPLISAIATPLPTQPFVSKNSNRIGYRVCVSVGRFINLRPSRHADA